MVIGAYEAALLLPAFPREVNAWKITPVERSQILLMCSCHRHQQEQNQMHSAAGHKQAF